MGRNVAIAVVILVILGGVGWYLLREQPATPAVATSQPVKPAPMPVQRTAPPAPVDDNAGYTGTEVPESLNGSDAAARSAAGELSTTLVKWLTPQEQLRKWVALVDAVADSKQLENNLPLQYPMSRFKVVRRNGALYESKRDYQRADALVAAITAIPPQQMADYYHAWSPLLERAYAELGRSGSFDERLTTAIQNLIDAPPLKGDARLKRPKVFYVYADPALEHSPQLTKLLWRLGPDNQRKLQEYLKNLQPLL